MVTSNLKPGVYEVFGNIVHYVDGEAYDIDAGQEVPEEVLKNFGIFIKDFDI